MIFLILLIGYMFYESDGPITQEELRRGALIQYACFIGAALLFIGMLFFHMPLFP